MAKKKEIRLSELTEEEKMKYEIAEELGLLDKVLKGDLIILDLFSTAHTHFDEYEGHDAVYCMLPNFGGRSGFMGRFNGVIDGYFENKDSHSWKCSMNLRQNSTDRALCQSNI